MSASREQEAAFLQLQTSLEKVLDASDWRKIAEYFALGGHVHSPEDFWPEARKRGDFSQGIISDAFVKVLKEIGLSPSLLDLISKYRERFCMQRSPTRPRRRVTTWDTCQAILRDALSDEGLVAQVCALLKITTAAPSRDTILDYVSIWSALRPLLISFLIDKKISKHELLVKLQEQLMTESESSRIVTVIATTINPKHLFATLSSAYFEHCFILDKKILVVDCAGISEADIQMRLQCLDQVTGSYFSFYVGYSYDTKVRSYTSHTPLPCAVPRQIASAGSPLLFRSKAVEVILNDAVTTANGTSHLGPSLTLEYLDSWKVVYDRAKADSRSDAYSYPVLKKLALKTPHKWLAFFLPSAISNSTNHHRLGMFLQNAASGPLLLPGNPTSLVAKQRSDEQLYKSTLYLSL